ncbi:MAG: APC family permease [Nocardiopsaceae bacterium]|jgi:amino acid transporter|nr:APC family permease [Nocardiopsaceae bacterium]
MAQTAPSIFARKATGLVREGSASSVLVYNINFVSIGLMLVFALIMIPAFYPGANVQGTFLAAFIFVSPTSITFARLAAAMPRSGGDYVYVSRILGPQWGMMSSLNNTIWWILYGGVPSAFFAYYGLTPLLRGIGILTNNATLVRYGNDLSTPTGAFIIGTLLIIGLVVIFATGLNSYFKIQNVLFVIAMIGILVTIGILITTSHTGFQTAFNHYIDRSTGHTNSFQAVIAAASHDGFKTAPFSLYWTLIPITWIYLELVFNQSSAYIGGEVRRPGRVQLWSMPVAAVVSTGIAMIIAWQMARVVGSDFLGSVSFNNGAAMGFGSTPVYTELVGYASGNVVLGVVVTFSFLFWSFSWLPGQILNASRNLLAYGIDGVMPAWLGRVNYKRHTPINALVVMGIGSIAALWLYTRPTGPFKTLTGIFGFILSFLMVSLAAMLFPYRQREAWEQSPVNWRWGRVPVVTIVGALSFAACGFMAWDYLNDPLSGLSVEPNNTGGLFGHQAFAMFILNIIIWVAGWIVYQVAKVVRRRQGVDLDSTYRELPVE